MINSRNRRAWAVLSAMAAFGLFLLWYQPQSLRKVSGAQIIQASFENPKTTFLVNFWAVWCEPCKEEIPALTELAKKHSEKLRVLLIQVDDSQDWEAGSRALAAMEALPMAFWPEGRPKEFFGKLGVKDPPGIPYTLILKDGKIVKNWMGAKTFSELELEVGPYFE